MLYKILIEDNLSENVILRYKSVAMSYADLHHNALALGLYWNNNGIASGERIVVVNDEPVKTVIALLACLAMGYIFVPVEANNSSELEHIINDCKPKAVFDGIIPPITDCSYTRCFVNPEAIGYILYTSGSTSKSKGVVAPLRTIAFCVDAINKRLGNSTGDRILCKLPLAFDYGLYQVFLALRYGAELTLIDENTSIIELPTILKENRITAFPVVPTLLGALLRSRLLQRISLPDLRYISSTGESLAPDLIQKAKAVLPHTDIIPMYGLTECKRVSIMPSGREDKIILGSCGLPLDGVRVTIDDVQDNIGELIVYGPNVMNGYWGDDEATNESFGIDHATGECFLRTGDLFSIDHDGFLYFKGRIKNLIKVRGHAVSGKAIEDRLKAVKEILEVSVIGVPDDINGEKICAFIYSNDANIESKILSVLKELPEYMQVKLVTVSDKPLPTNKNGKIDNAKLRMSII